MQAVLNFRSISNKINRIKIILSHYNRNIIKIMENESLKSRRTLHSNMYSTRIVLLTSRPSTVHHLSSIHHPSTVLRPSTTCPPTAHRPSISKLDDGRWMIDGRWTDDGRSIVGTLKERCGICIH